LMGSAWTMSRIGIPYHPSFYDCGMCAESLRILQQEE
jgi:hypothetical protein